MNEQLALSNISVFGISHWHTPVEMREKFSLSETQQADFLSVVKQKKFASVIVLSTCNRTEIYAVAKTLNPLIRLFCEITGNKRVGFDQHGYIKKGEEAIEHLFKVAGGLDSQILGDFQIAGQLKQAYASALDQRTVDPYLSRMVQDALNTSKRIKQKTNLSNGSASVAYAAVAYLKEQVSNLQQKRILLYGCGKTGVVACKNLLKHVDKENIALINRTYEKASGIARRFGIKVNKHDKLQEALSQADIIIVATGSSSPTVTLGNLNVAEKKIILDLSMPRNVAPGVGEKHTLINLDQLNEISRDALEQRKQSLPVAKNIIQASKADFIKWTEKREFIQKVRAQLSSAIFHNELEEDEQNEESVFVKSLVPRYIRLV